MGLLPGLWRRGRKHALSSPVKATNRAVIPTNELTQDSFNATASQTIQRTGGAARVCLSRKMRFGGPSIITKSPTARELTSYSVPLGSMLV